MEGVCSSNWGGGSLTAIRTVAFSTMSKSLRRSLGLRGRLCELVREMEGVAGGRLLRTAISIDDSEAAESLSRRIFGD